MAGAPIGSFNGIGSGYAPPTGTVNPGAIGATSGQDLNQVPFNNTTVGIFTSPSGFASSLTAGQPALALAINKILYSPDGLKQMAINTPYGLAPYIGQVATRCSSAFGFYSGNWYTDQCTVHTAAEDLTTFTFSHGNWSTVSQSDAGTGGAMTIYCSIEYPVGVLTPVTFGGATSQIVANGANSTPDPVTIPGGIPKGADFGIRAWTNFSAGLAGNACALGSLSTSGIKEGANNSNGTSIPNNTTVVTASPAYNAGGIAVPVLFIAALTNRPSMYLAGDSLTRGYTDVADSQLRVGQLERAWEYGVINCGLGGETITGGTMSTRFAKRSVLIQYCSHVNFAYGTNDWLGVSAASIISAANSYLTSYAAGKKVSVCMLPPANVTGTYTTEGGQTANANDLVRVAYNNLLLAGGITSHHYLIDLNAIYSNTYAGSLWKAFATAITTDGTHPNQYGCNYGATKINFKI